jgi:hypothetical protein
MKSTTGVELYLGLDIHLPFTFTKLMPVISLFFPVGPIYPTLYLKI